ncbi:MAG: hypothetical protein OHK0028_24060 [Deltaproteobacteria bacterium]
MALALLLSIALASCGGGGVTAGGGTGGTGVGPVTGFGSVIVNGVRYDDAKIDNTNFFDDHGRTKADLVVGMMVAVFGSINGPDGTADNITVLRHVDGPMDDNGVDLSTSRLKVMGQDILVDTSTVFDDGIANLADLRTLQGANVNHPELEVHGSADNNGVIRATFIHKWSDDRAEGGEQVRGTVTGLDTGTKTFSVGRQSVNYSGAGSVPAGLDNGAFVEVKGTLRVSDNVLAADSVRIEDATGGQPSGGKAEVEGYVNREMTPGASFELIGPNGVQAVTWTSGTTIFDGGTAADIRAGAKVEVEGIRKPDKSLAATKIEIRRASNVRIESTVTGATAASITIFGKTVTVNALTQYKDSSGAGLKTFGQADIAVNDNVRVAAFVDNTASPPAIVATRVERIGSIAIDRHILQGPVDFIDPGGSSLRILGARGIPGGFGITVVTSPGTTKFLRADGSEFATQAEFFAAIAPGDIVKARGNQASPGVDMNANEVQIEPAIDD